MTTNDKKVLMIVFSSYPSDPRVRREAEALGETGHHVDILCLKKSHESKRQTYKNISVKRVLAEDTRRESMGRYLLLTTLFFIICLWHTFKWSFTRRYDLVQIHNMPDHLVFAALPCKIRRAKVLLDLHDLTPELFRTKWGNGYKRNLLPIVELVEKMSCKFSDHVLTTSDGFKESLVSRGIPVEKIDVIHNSADERIFSRLSCKSSKSKDTGPQLVYHGTVAPRFGLHVAIKALPYIIKQLPDAKLSIYGKYEPTYKICLEELVGELNLKNSVLLEGFIKQEEVAQVISRADMGIVPYIEDEFMNLALSTKTFEYVVMGLPVAASKLDSIGRIFSEEAIAYFSSGNFVELASKVISVFREDRNFKESMMRKAIDEYKQLEWVAVSERYRGIVNDLIG